MQSLHALNCYKKLAMWTMLVLLILGTAFAHAEGMVSPPLTIRSGTLVTVRLNQTLSSDHSRVGDLFYATLTQPLVVNGIVTAHRGQTVAGQVVEARKAGRVSGMSRLAIALTNLTVADGRTVSIQSQLLVSDGGRSVGRDSAAIAGTTGFGAAIGAAAGWGSGALIGAGAGAAAGTLGVLLTRGKSTVIVPETLLTFRIMAPATVQTNDAPQAFRFVERADYSAPEPYQSAMVPASPAVPVYTYLSGYQPALYPYYYSPYSAYPYFTPGISFFFGYPGYPAWYGYPHYFGYVPSPRPFHYVGGITVRSFR